MTSRRKRWREAHGYSLARAHWTEQTMGRCRAWQGAEWEAVTQVMDSATRNGWISQLIKEKWCDRLSDCRDNQRECWVSLEQGQCAGGGHMQLIRKKAEVTEMPNWDQRGKVIRAVFSFGREESREGQDASLAEPCAKSSPFIGDILLNLLLNYFLCV